MNRCEGLRSDVTDGSGSDALSEPWAVTTQHSHEHGTSIARDGYAQARRQITARDGYAQARWQIMAGGGEFARLCEARLGEGWIGSDGETRKLRNPARRTGRLSNRGCSPQEVHTAESDSPIVVTNDTLKGVAKWAMRSRSACRRLRDGDRVRHFVIGRALGFRIAAA